MRSTWAFSTSVKILFFMVRLLACGAAARLGLLASPAGDFLVIAAQQHLRHGHAAEDTGPGVLRVFEAARLGVRLLREALRVAEHPGDGSDHSINHRAEGQTSELQS